jgi:hypothetical protein
MQRNCPRDRPSGLSGDADRRWGPYGPMASAIAIGYAAGVLAAPTIRVAQLRSSVGAPCDNVDRLRR